MADIYRGADASVKNEFAEEIRKAVRELIDEMLHKTSLKAGDIFVVGCSSSEILGSNIGKGSSYEAAISSACAAATSLPVAVGMSYSALSLSIASFSAA